MEPQILFFFFFLIFIAIVVIGIVSAQRRKKEMREWGEKNGLQFTPKSRSLDHEFPQFSCLCQGHSRYARNILTGTLGGVPICAFDYHYSVGSGKDEHHYSLSALIVNTGLPLKPLYIRTENFFDKVTEFVGFDDIDFESAEFSREFYVKSPDKRWAYDVLHQKSMEYLLGAPRFILDFQGPYIMAYRDRTFAIPDFEDAHTVIMNMLTLLPEYLLRELRGEK